MGNPLDPSTGPVYPAVPPDTWTPPSPPRPGSNPPAAPAAGRGRQLAVAAIAVVLTLVLGAAALAVGATVDDDRIEELETAAVDDQDEIDDLEREIDDLEQELDDAQDALGDLDGLPLDELPNIEDIEDLEDLFPEDLFPEDFGEPIEDDLPLAPVPGIEGGSVVEDQGITVESLQVGRSFGYLRVIGRVVDSVGGRDADFTVTLFAGDAVVAVAHGYTTASEAGERTTVDFYSDDAFIEGITRFEFQVDEVYED